MNEASSAIRARHQNKISSRTMFFLYLWSFFNEALWFVGRYLLFFTPKIQKWFIEKSVTKAFLEEIKELRNKFKESYLFFCSSAGEYEQALPIIRRLEQDPSVLVVIVFFSQSGIKYANARKERTKYFLGFRDVWWLWDKLFANLQVKATFVVRHEFWPSFLFCSKKWGPLYLVDASLSEKPKSSLKWFGYGIFCRTFSKIFLVAEKDKLHFCTRAKCLPSDLIETGDTKYDRVMERIQEKKDSIQELKAKCAPYLEDKSVLVLGSAWFADVNICLQAMRILKSKDSSSARQVVLALHEPSSKNVEWCEAEIVQNGFKSVRLSDVLSGRSVSEEKIEFILVDSLGILCELYGLGKKALVGGAFHHKVHNVLEPASHGIEIAFGHHFRNSPEAVVLVEQGLAKVIRDADDFASWWQGEDPLISRSLNQFLQNQCGASERVLSNVRKADHYQRQRL